MGAVVAGDDNKGISDVLVVGISVQDGILFSI